MNPIGSSQGINDISQIIASGDIQTLIQMVQGERVRLLDAQLVDQVKAVQARNDQIAKLNDVLSALNKYAGAISGTDSQSKIPNWTAEKADAYEKPLNDTIQAAGITDMGWPYRAGMVTAKPGESNTPGYTGVVFYGTNACSGPSSTKGEIDAAITKVKGMIDAESNNQQMDMLRLQSLTNKKNESIEILTNTQKKHNESASGIIRNI